MNTVHHAAAVRNSDSFADRCPAEILDDPAFDAAYDSGAASSAWEPAPDTSLDWLRAECAVRSATPADRDPRGAAAMVGLVLCDVIHSFELHNATDAAAYAADKSLRRTFDLDREPVILTRNSPLARALDIEASWYRGYGTTAARVLAAELETTADEAEAYGALDLADYLVEQRLHELDGADRVMIATATN